MDIESAYRDTLVAMATHTHYGLRTQPRCGIFDCLFDVDEVHAVRTPRARTKSKCRSGARQVRKVEQEVSEGDRLTPVAATMYRAVSARCDVFAQDRPGIAYASKELCRDFAAPDFHAMARLRRPGTSLKGRPIFVYTFGFRDRPNDRSIMADTDVAGCRGTRRSTSGGVALYGSDCVRRWSSAHTTIALSSDEAGLGGLCTGASQGIGLRSICIDFGPDRSIHLYADATSAIGTSRRLGVGKVRDLDTSFLWLQHKVRAGDPPPSPSPSLQTRRIVPTRSRSTSLAQCSVATSTGCSWLLDLVAPTQLHSKPRLEHL